MDQHFNIQFKKQNKTTTTAFTEDKLWKPWQQYDSGAF